jgi:Uma2 family endonuclease
MATKTLMTLEEFERLSSDDGVLYELDEGELVSMTFPMPKHARVQLALMLELGAFLKQRPLGELLCDTGYLLSSDPPTLRGPDLGFLRAGRKIEPEARITGAPDLAVEIVSPSDTASALLRKVQQYLASGARTVWVVYPDNAQVHVFEASGQTRVLSREDVLTEPNLLPGFSVPVAALFE